MRGLIGKKIGMTQFYNDQGSIVPVTVIEAGPCVVTQIKTKNKDGYDAIQIGFTKMKEKHSNKALNGHFKKAGSERMRFLAEFSPVPKYKYETALDPTNEANIVSTSKLICKTPAPIAAGKNFCHIP